MSAYLALTTRMTHQKALEDTPATPDWTDGIDARLWRLGRWTRAVLTHLNIKVGSTALQSVHRWLNAVCCQLSEVEERSRGGEGNSICHNRIPKSCIKTQNLEGCFWSGWKSIPLLMDHGSRRVQRPSPILTVEASVFWESVDKNMFEV